MSALNEQVGGSHYKTMKIQPFEFSMANGLNPIQHTIIKYVVRHREKNKLEDLKKAIHCTKLLAEFEYPGCDLGNKEAPCTRTDIIRIITELFDNALVLGYSPEKALEIALEKAFI